MSSIVLLYFLAFIAPRFFSSRFVFCQQQHVFSSVDLDKQDTEKKHE